MNKSRSLNRLWAMPAAALLIVGLGCQAILSALPPLTATLGDGATPVEPPTSTPLSSSTPKPEVLLTEAVSGEYSVPDEGVFHIEFGTNGTYDHYPPSSGVHYGRILEWGFYEDEVPPEFWVHSLEHGGVVILYNCTADCKVVEAALQELIDTASPEDQFNEVKILTSPNSKIESPVVALAWGYQLDLDSIDHEVLLDFYNRHVNQGPELAP